MYCDWLQNVTGHQAMMPWLREPSWKCDAKVMFSEFLSFCPRGKGIFSRKVLGGGGGGVLESKNAHPGRGGVMSIEVPITYCCLHVISLRTCSQKEELVYSHAARHSGKLHHPGHEHFSVEDSPTPLGMSTLSHQT